jgi:hypothetical protein
MEELGIKEANKCTHTIHLILSQSEMADIDGKTIECGLFPREDKLLIELFDLGATFANEIVNVENSRSRIAVVDVRTLLHQRGEILQNDDHVGTTDIDVFKRMLITARVVCVRKQGKNRTMK